MPRVARQIKREWRVAPGLVPGQANEGLVARILASPARLAEPRGGIFMRYATLAFESPG
jgi:hypothetical protein